MEAGKKGLSKREQMMVFGGGFVGIVIVLFQFVITPLNADIEEKTILRDDLNMQWIRIESQLASFDSILENRDDLIDQYHDIREKYIEQQINHEIGRYLTLLVREHDFLEVSQSISGVSPFVRGDISAATAAFLEQPISMNLIGGYLQLQSILDGLKEMPSLSITNFSIGLSGEDGDQMDSVGLNFRIIMFGHERIDEQLRAIRYVEEDT